MFISISVYFVGGNAYILALWSGHRAREPILQGIHLIWSVGSTISPFIVRPFLVEEDINVNGTKCNVNSTSDNIFGTELPSQDTTGSNITNLCHDDRDITQVRFAYMLVGSIVFLIAILYIIIYFLLGHHLLRSDIYQKHTKSVVQETTHQPRCFRFGFLVLIFIFYFVYLISEGIAGGYISLFVVEGLGWTVKRSALITSAFWGAHGVGRLLGVPISFVLTPKIMLYITIVLTCIGYITLLFVHVIGDTGVYIGVMLGGLGVSTIFPSMLLWVSNFLPSSSTVSAVCLTGSSMGFPVVGGLLKHLAICVMCMPL